MMSFARLTRSRWDVTDDYELFMPEAKDDGQSTEAASPAIRPCRHFARGFCFYGNSCRQSHDTMILAEEGDALKQSLQLQRSLVLFRYGGKEKRPILRLLFRVASLHGYVPRELGRFDTSNHDHRGYGDSLRTFKYEEKGAESISLRSFARLGSETTAAITDLREYIELGDELGECGRRVGDRCGVRPFGVEGSGGAAAARLHVCLGQLRHFSVAVRKHEVCFNTTLF